MKPLLRDDPKKIGPYRLVGRLGVGGMGVVGRCLWVTRPGRLRHGDDAPPGSRPRRCSSSQSAGGVAFALTRDDGSGEAGDSGRRNVTASTSTTTTTTAPVTTQVPVTSATTLPPPPPPPPPRFANVDCAIALAAIDEFTLSDRLQLQALFQGFMGPAPGSDGTALRIVGLPIASQSGDPYDAVWSPDTGFSVTGGFFEFELLDDPATFPVIVFLDEANNFVCEPNVPTG